MRIQCCHKHQGMLQILLHFLLISLNAIYTMDAEAAQSVTKQGHRLQEVINNDGHKYIQLKISLACRKSNSCIISHDLYSNHGHCFTLGWIDPVSYTHLFDAFESVNLEPCGLVDARGLHMNKKLLIHTEGAFALEDELCKDVVLIKLIPGMNPQLFDKLAEMDIRGIVIEAFGAGGINFVRRDLISELEKIVSCGISVVVCSQCLYEYSDFSIYQTGQKVLQHGVIQGYDMTSEACVTKLMWALGRSSDTAEVKKIFETNYVNEITLP